MKMPLVDAVEDSFGHSFVTAESLTKAFLRQIRIVWSNLRFTYVVNSLLLLLFDRYFGKTLNSQIHVSLGKHLQKVS